MKEMICIGGKMAIYFSNAKDQFKYLQALAILSVPKKNLLTCYSLLCRDKKMVTIENLPNEGKQKTWETAKEIADGRFNTSEDMKDLCRCLLTMEYFMQ